jgi:hypothetical protein
MLNPESDIKYQTRTLITVFLNNLLLRPGKSWKEFEQIVKCRRPHIASLISGKTETRKSFARINAYARFPQQYG